MQQRVQQLLLLQPLGQIASGCLRDQAHLPTRALSSSLASSCQLQRVNLSTSSSGSCRLQDRVHAPGGSNNAQLPALPVLLAAAGPVAARTRCEHSHQPFLCQHIRSVSTSSSSSSSKPAPPPPLSRAQAARLAELDYKSVTVGRIIDQYTHPVSFIESGAFRSWSKAKEFGIDKLRRLYQEWQARMAARNNIPGHTAEGLRQEAARIYLQVQQAQAAMQPDLARDVVSKDVFIKLRAQTEQRRRQGWGSIDWQLLDADKLDKHIKQVQARAVKFFPDSRHDYLQFTLCITSKQRFAAYGKDRALLAGDPGEVLDVTEYCVFERKTVARVKKAQGASMTGVEVNQQTEVEGGRWRLVGWLHP